MWCVGEESRRDRDDVLRSFFNLRSDGERCCRRRRRGRDIRAARGACLGCLPSRNTGWHQGLPGSMYAAHWSTYWFTYKMKRVQSSNVNRSGCGLVMLLRMPLLNDRLTSQKPLVVNTIGQLKRTLRRGRTARLQGRKADVHLQSSTSYVPRRTSRCTRTRLLHRGTGRHVCGRSRRICMCRDRSCFPQKVWESSGEGNGKTGYGQPF